MKRPLTTDRGKRGHLVMFRRQGGGLCSEFLGPLPVSPVVVINGDANRTTTHDNMRQLVVETVENLRKKEERKRRETNQSDSLPALFPVGV